MSVTFTKTAPRQTYFSKPADTNAATVFTSAAEAVTVESLNIATTLAANVTVWIYNGTTDYLQLDAYAMGANANALFTFGNPVLRSTWAVKVMTSNADDATFTLTVAEETSRMAAP